MELPTSHTRPTRMPRLAVRGPPRRVPETPSPTEGCSCQRQLTLPRHAPPLGPRARRRRPEAGQDRSGRPVESLNHLPVSNKYLLIGACQGYVHESSHTGPLFLQGRAASPAISRSGWASNRIRPGISLCLFILSMFGPNSLILHLLQLGGYGQTKLLLISCSGPSRPDWLTANWKLPKLQAQHTIEGGSEPWT